MKSKERMKFWRQHIEVQKLSRVSVQAYCDRERISTYSFYQWRKRLSAGGLSAAVRPSSAFAAVEIIGAGPSSQLAHNAGVKLPDPKWTAAFVRHLFREF